MFDYAIFIGKFSPIHDGHISVLLTSLEQAKKVIFVLGQCYEARNTRLPFTEDERKDMIALATNNDPRVIVAFAENFMYNDTAWVASIQDAVNDAIMGDGGNPDEARIVLTGLYKDNTSYYLNIFPQWKWTDGIKCETYETIDKEYKCVLSSTFIRSKIFEGEIDYLLPHMNLGVINYIKQLMNFDPVIWDELKYQWKYEQKYSSIYGSGPFVTVDACVVQAGHVLLVTRGSEYGKGLLAMPGGFLNKIENGKVIREKAVDGMIRELREETGLKVPEKVLRGCITKRECYDDPYRDNRGQLITHAFLIELNNDPNGLPKVKGSDDAMKADWYPISFVKDNRHKFFADHWSMLYDLIGF